MQLRHAVGTCDARELRTRARPEKKGEQNISREGKIEIEIEIEKEIEIEIGDRDRDRDKDIQR